MNGLQLAKELSTSTRVVRELLNSGIIAATKKRGVWEIDMDSYQHFRKKNNAKVKKLKAEYVRLFWQGLEIEQLQGRVEQDFETRGIVFPAQNFAEKVIYEDLMRKKREICKKPS